MRIGGLYFRMLVVFVVVQLVAMLTMFSLVKLGKIRPPFVRHAEERTASIKRVVQHELAGLDAISPEKKKTAGFHSERICQRISGASMDNSQRWKRH